MMTQCARGRDIKLAASGHRHPQKERHCRDRAARTDSEMTRAGGDCYRLIRLVCDGWHSRAGRSGCV